MFQRVLYEAGLIATIRESRGKDISAACGMLRVEEDRQGLVHVDINSMTYTLAV